MSNIYLCSAERLPNAPQGITRLVSTLVAPHL
jgi:hypothetical protein